MPTDIRVIDFNNVEIEEAITDYCMRMGRFTPGKRATALTLSNRPEIAVSFGDASDGPRSHLKQTEVVAVLILYCKKVGIPIAQRASKSLRIANDAVSRHLALPSS